jgi:hypothetical protein
VNINITVSTGGDYMTYQEIRMPVKNYEEHREKIKLLYN